MSVKIVLEVHVDPQRVDDVVKFLRENLPDTRAYEGFESLSVFQNADDPSLFLFDEQWTTRAHYDAYLGWRNETGVLTELVNMCVGEPSIKAFNYIGV